MKLIFDKGLETEKYLDVERVNIRPLFARINGSFSGHTADGAPDLSSFTNEQIASVSLEADDGAEIPLVGNYSRLVDVSITYEEGGSVYHVSVAAEGNADVQEGAGA